MRVTNNKHILTSDINNINTNPRLVQVSGLQEQNDGNNVNLDSQMSEQSKNHLYKKLNRITG